MPAAATSLIRVEFDHSEYRFSHGKEPRGYGSWAFGVERGDPQPEDIIWAQGTLSEAKKQAKAFVRANPNRPDIAGCSGIVLVVLP